MTRPVTLLISASLSAWAGLCLMGAVFFVFRDFK